MQACYERQPGWNRVALVPLMTALSTGSVWAGEEDGHPASHLGGPSSVSAQILSDAESRSRPGWKTTRLQLREALQRDYGLALGSDYNALYQYAADSAAEDAAAGGAFRLYGHWTLANRGEPNAGSLVFKWEHRHNLGGLIPPQDLGPRNGYAGLTAGPFSDAGSILTNLYWTQALLDNRVGFNAGIVDVTDYVDIFGLVNPWTDFNNSAFSTNPTIPAPSQGLGAAVRWLVTLNYYVLAGLADANGDPGHPENAFDSFFDAGEYFHHIELGWIGSWENRASDNAHILAWQVDEREEAGVDDGWGVAVSFSRNVGEHWLPFVRGGYADGGGALVERSISTGIGYRFDGRADYLAIAASWGRPPDDASDNTKDQYSIEGYYRLQLLPQLQLTPGIQYLIDPALDPRSDKLWVLGVRVRAAL